MNHGMVRSAEILLIGSEFFIVSPKKILMLLARWWESISQKMIHMMKNEYMNKQTCCLFLRWWHFWFHDDLFGWKKDKRKNKWKFHVACVCIERKRGEKICYLLKGLKWSKLEWLIWTLNRISIFIIHFQVHCSQKKIINMNSRQFIIH